MEEIFYPDKFEPCNELTLLLLNLMDHFTESTQLIIKLRHGMSYDGKKHSWKSIVELLSRQLESPWITVHGCKKKYRDFIVSTRRQQYQRELSDSVFELCKFCFGAKE